MKLETLKKGLMPIVAIIFLATIMVNCSKDENKAVTTPEQNAVEKVVNIDNTGSGCTPIYAGQNTLVGEVCLVDDYTTNELTVTYTVIDGWEITEIHFAIGDQTSDIPKTKKGNMIPGQFPYSFTFTDGVLSHSFTIPFSAFGASGCDDDQQYYAAAHCSVRLPDGSGGYQTETGWGNGSVTPGNNWGEMFGFKLECYPTTGLGSETAFAYGCLDATCFFDLEDENNIPFNRWGWSNGPLVYYGIYTFVLYADAGQCNVNSEGTIVGTLTVDYDGSTAIVEFVTCGNYTMDETHLYVGDIPLHEIAGEKVIEPSFFPGIHEDLNGVTSDQYTITGLTGPIYVVAHAVVVGDLNDGNCTPEFCDFLCEPVSAGTATIVSDLSTNIIDGNVSGATYPTPAVAAWVHPSWNSQINNVSGFSFSSTYTPDPIWIWESYNPVNVVTGDEVIFERQFEIPGIPNSGTLSLTVDNGFIVTLNGHELGYHSLPSYPGVFPFPDFTQAYVDLYGWQEVQTYTGLEQYLIQGTNILQIIAYNEHVSNGTNSSNPGALIYGLEVAWDAVICP